MTVVWPCDHLRRCFTEKLWALPHDKVMMASRMHLLLAMRIFDLAERRCVFRSPVVEDPGYESILNSIRFTGGGTL